MDSRTTIRAVQLASITPSLILTGYTLGFSQNGVSQLYDQPANVSTPLFNRIFHSGLRVATPLAILSTSASAYLAYAVLEKRRLWAAAGALTLGMGAWTQFVMMAGINRLIQISENKAAQEKATANLEHRQLLVKWVKQNYVRTIATLVAGVLGTWASTT